MGLFLASLITIIVNCISVLLLLYALLSFTPLEPWHPVRRFIEQLAEPIVRPFRSFIPPVGMFDLSVMIAMLIIQVVGRILVQLVIGIF